MSSYDSLYHDNTDPDGGYGVEFTVLAPTRWATLQGVVGGPGGEPTLAATGELACGARVTLAARAPARCAVGRDLGRR